MQTTGHDQESKTSSFGNRRGRPFDLTLLLLLLAALMTTAFSTEASASETESGAAVTVLVFNFRQVPGQTLAKAKDEAGRILGRAGVHVTWQDCPIDKESCEVRGRVFLLAILKGPIQNQWQDTVSGYANLPNHLAIAYYDYLPRIPNESSTASETATILGSVVAHELGHLLLGAGHSIGGIMQAHWDVQQTRRALSSQLLFLPDEAKRMQGSLQIGGQPSGDVVSALTSH